MMALLMAILNGIIRRVDGGDKSWALKISPYGRKAAQFLVRIVPVGLGAYLLCTVWQPEEWYWYAAHVIFGGLISGSMQRGYGGWEHFSLRQVTQHYIATIGYVALAPLSPVLSAVGVFCCLLAGLTHPIGAKLALRRYTEYAELLTGFFLLVPFAIV